MFAWAREAAGFEQQVLQLASGATVADAVRVIGQKLPLRAAQLLSSAAFAINQRYARPEARLSDGDELAVLPPVSGG